MTDLIALAYEALSGQLAVDEEAFRIVARRFAIAPVMARGNVVGATFTDGPEIHIAVLPEGRRVWATRRVLRGLLQPLIDEFGGAQTTVREGHTQGLEFCTRIGFRSIGTVDGIVHMICEKTL